MKEEKLEQEVGILDILLDEDNEDPITLYDENDKAIQFDQVAIIPMDEKLYAILKPIDEMEMLLRIKALLRRAKIVNERKITIGNLVLDYDSYSVIKNDTVIKLPQKEFQLLFKLLSYPGKTFTRIQLMDEIWGMDCDTGWETVTVHIARLRKRFEGWKEFEIQSIRGLGYKVVKQK